VKGNRQRRVRQKSRSETELPTALFLSFASVGGLALSAPFCIYSHTQQIAMKLPRGHTPRVTADGKVEVHRHDEEKLARGGFGERMLRSLGWRDGDGLGVGRQGRAEAVRVTQKLDNKGVREVVEREERGEEREREEGMRFG